MKKIGSKTRYLIITFVISFLVLPGIASAAPVPWTTEQYTATANTNVQNGPPLPVSASYSDSFLGITDTSQSTITGSYMDVAANSNKWLHLVRAKGEFSGAYIASGVNPLFQFTYDVTNSSVNPGYESVRSAKLKVTDLTTGHVLYNSYALVMDGNTYTISVLATGGHEISVNFSAFVSADRDNMNSQSEQLRLNYSTAVAPAGEYEIISLGDFYGHGLNNSGLLAGEKPLDSGFPHAFIRDNNAGFQDLGALGGNGYELSSAYDISCFGQAVGRTTTPEGYDHAFLWDSENGMRDLGTLGGNYSYAYGTNDSGVVVGEANTGVCQGVACNNAFIWSYDNGMQGLGTLGGNFSAAFDVNNSGKVVGMSYNSSLNHAFVWDSMNGMRDIGLFAGADKSSQANAINDAGQVVGFSTSSFSSWPNPHYPSTAFIWDEVDGLHDLGTLGYSSVATDINNSGQVVGYNVFGSAGYYWERAFIWDSVNGMRELKDLIPQNSGWFLSRAEAINDAGQIVVAGYNENNPWDGTRAFLLTPTAASGPVRIAGPAPVYYSSLQSAYDDAVDEDIIQSRIVILSEDLYIDGNKSVTIRGGYDSDYAVSNGVTILNGNIVISNGTLIIDSIKVVL